MAKFDMMVWYSEDEYGKAWTTIEADSEEEARAKFLKAFFASEESTNSMIAVIPEGGRITCPTVPCFSNRSFNSSALVLAGKFFTRITVLLRAAEGWNNQ